ncbi:MAG: tRNA lysidine(34) synthetase TilS [Undibacterium sp.]|nr:tRNA lysidine(34) synthetase TilS [Undibacterium sp.]
MSRRQAFNQEEFEQNFFAQLRKVLTRQGDAGQGGIAVAYSGGVDSTVLLYLVTRFANANKIPIFAFHVHHGLSPNADQWQAHCSRTCLSLGVHFDTAEVTVKNIGEGIEAAARGQRYLALGAMCRVHHCSFLLTAHHLDDQAETMLMQLFRGTGLRGLSGMDVSNYAPQLLGNDRLLLARPLLAEAKYRLLAYANKLGLSHVEDESNLELCYTRNALRHHLMPAIEELAPNFAERLSRTALHVRSANRLLDEIAANDLGFCLVGDALQLSSLKTLSDDRIDNLLRYWFASRGLQLPSTSKLVEMRAQLFDARDDARLTVQHQQYSLHRYGGKIVLCNRSTQSNHVGELSAHWNGEDFLSIPELKGRLIFLPSNEGVSASFLRKHRLSIRPRIGGERLRLAQNRPSRDLKSHFQSMRIPFWRRDKLPYIYIEDELFFVGLLGVDAHFHSVEDEACIELVWQADEERFEE